MILLPLVLALAQQPTQPSQLPTARTDTSPFRRLELPTPSLLREGSGRPGPRSEEHTSELQSHSDLVCRLLLEKKKMSSKPLITPPSNVAFKASDIKYIVL